MPRPARGLCEKAVDSRSRLLKHRGMPLFPRMMRTVQGIAEVLNDRRKIAELGLRPRGFGFQKGLTIPPSGSFVLMLYAPSIEMTTKQPPWIKPNPRKSSHKKMTPVEKSEAKERARKRGCLILILWTIWPWLKRNAANFLAIVSWRLRFLDRRIDFVFALPGQFL